MIGGVEDNNAGIFISARVVREVFRDIRLDGAVVTDTSGWQDIRNTIDGSGGHITNASGWVVERNLTHIVEVIFRREVGERFDFLEAEICAKIVAEGGSQAEEIGDREIFFEDFVFDADEDFLLASATGEIATSSAMASAGETESLLSIYSIFFASLKDSAGPVIIHNVFIKSNGDAAEGINNLDEGAPVQMSVILKINTKNGANFCH